MKSDAIFQVRVAGGENIMGTELINLGASTKLTLEKVFSQLVITPGEDTWFIVSDSENLTGDPAALRDRFTGIENANRLFNPQALLSVYLPDRAVAAVENYSSADLPEKLLINRDSRPLTHLYSLLLAAKQSGAPVTKLIKLLALAGPLAFVVPVLVFVVLRIIYILRTEVRSQKSEKHLSSDLCPLSSFDSSFLVFSAGWVAIGVVIVLMYLYQTRFGSLYLYIGVISSMFMVGLTIGAALMTSLVARRSGHGSRVTSHVFVVIFVHSLVLCTIAFWPAEQLTHLIFLVAFVLSGLCAGSYFPIAARQLADSAFEAGQAGSKLETADHIGAAVGGLLTSLALVPVLGVRLTLFGFILLILVNVPPALLRIYKTERVCSFDTIAFRLRKLAPLEMLQVGDILYKRRFLTGLGYVLFGVCVSIVLCSNLLTEAGARLRPSLPQHSAQALAGELRLEQESTVLRDSTRQINYFRVWDANDKLTGYIFSSEDLAPEVRGFGGKMNLAIYVDDPGGKLINFHIIRSNETPAYLELLSEWRSSLNERQLFQPGPFADIHAVTGATVSSEAILSALQTSGHRFATQILGRAVEAGPKEKTHRAAYLPDNHAIYLISAFALALIVIYRGGFWSRLAMLIFNLVLGGIILNTQYSSEQIATLLSVHTPALKLTGAFLLVIGVPFFVIIFGNIYCGYICPFGAAQELLGYVLPGRFKQPIQAESMQKARFIKYVVLLVLIFVFFFSRNRTTLAADPLISFFNPATLVLDFRCLSFTSIEHPAMLLIVATALIGSLFYGRFWCRYLCPAGAFLSLLNSVAILKRYLPAKKFGRCEFGLTPKDQMDCIHCDRCRYVRKQKSDVRKQKSDVRRQKSDVRRQKSDVRWQAFCLLFSVLCILFFVSAVSVSRFLQVIPMGRDYSAVLAPSGGQPRDIDMQRVRTLIEQKKLSDQEAEFYKKLE